ncbi:MAG: YihY/virulence factor BrkB family protein [Actinomycetia bacterium]|nr:YihY/virulence factor BrkB family protein [Actinomycetes bacterium]
MAEPDEDTSEPSGDEDPAEGGDGEPSEAGDGGPNLIDRTLDRVDAIQRGIPPVAVVHAVLKKYGEDRCGQLAMMLSYRGFFAIFPLLLAFVAVVSLLLQDNPDLRDQLIDSTLSAVPVIGSEIQDAASVPSGSVVVVVGSVLVSIWAGLGLLEVLQETLNTIWGVPLYERPPWIIRRLRALPGAVLIGACLVLSGASAWIFSDGDLPWVQRAAGYLLPFLAGALCYLGLHWLLCVRKVPFTSQLWGAGFVGAAWFGLQLLGTWYVNRYVLQASDRYGIFVVVFGILSWAYLLGLLYLYGNELASVMHDRRWPRSLTGRNLGPADVEAQARVLRRELRVEGTGLDVEVPELPR